LLGHLLNRLAPQTQAICLSANGDPARFSAYHLPVLADLHPNRGPLAGVEAALAWAESLGAVDLLVVAADTPFIPLDLAARLAPAPGVASAGGRIHHLVCRLPVMTRPVLAAWLAEGHTRAGDFLRLIGARPVSFDEDVSSDHPAAFLNINTPDDLAEARKHLPGPGQSVKPPP
jgi:molybdopterin-guanine dinucleotide biosynthesis protein A